MPDARNPEIHGSEMLPSTMKAWRFHKATKGAENHMRIEMMPLPAEFHHLPPDSTLIRVQIASLNPVDIKFAEVPYVGGYMHPMPATPGLDGAGTVVDTTDLGLREGQLVTFRLPAQTAKGALQEYVVVPRECCAAVPDGVSLEQAATVGTCGLTAVQFMANHLPESQSQQQMSQSRVFINGGSGETGVFQIQVAKALGCFVAASCSTANVEFCKSLGADIVIDYRQGFVGDALEDIVQGDDGKLFDLVVDNVALRWKLYKASDAYLTPKGQYVQVGATLTMRNILDFMCAKLWPA